MIFICVVTHCDVIHGQWLLKTFLSFSNFTQEDYVNAGKFAMSHANEADYYAQKFGDTFMNSQ